MKQAFFIKYFEKVFSKYYTNMVTGFSINPFKV